MLTNSFNKNNYYRLTQSQLSKTILKIKNKKCDNRFVTTVKKIVKFDRYRR